MMSIPATVAVNLHGSVGRLLISSLVFRHWGSNLLSIHPFETNEIDRSKHVMTS